MMRLPRALARGNFRRALTRIDLRLAILLAGVTAVFSSLLLCGLLAYAVKESFEEQRAAVDEAIRNVEGAVERHAAVGELHRGAAYRVRDTDGRDVTAGGAWPAADLVQRAAGLRTALLARKDQFFVVERREPTGTLVGVAWPLHHFVRERGELTTRAVIVVLIGLLGSLAIGVLSARRALRPVRDTTRAIRAIDPRRLGMRIPVRGTADDVDGLAAATNEVLGRLEWSFDQLSRFGADVAHELRTPVNRVLNTAEVALTTTDDAGAKDEALAGIRGTAEGMRRTIEQLLFLARGEEGRVRLAASDLDLGDVVGGLVDLYAAEAERVDKTLRIEAAAVAVRADRELIERAVVNLLENALCHTDAGATIRVGIAARNGTAIVSVEDTGPGIPVADHEHVFSRFVRLDGARAPGGAGLGLPIARMVARLHDGDLVLAASSLGGAAFSLLLPRRA
jgi:signal transduction histidine kinase